MVCIHLNGSPGQGLQSISTGLQNRLAAELDRPFNRTEPMDAALLEHDPQGLVRPRGGEDHLRSDLITQQPKRS